ncbi:ABCA5 protein, partial [Chloroceryle aenea]|nr:ABCA5 protein [Chloroceryle aenea]
GVWRQTRALLFKNCLITCRTKKSSVQVSGVFPAGGIFVILWLQTHPAKNGGQRERSGVNLNNPAALKLFHSFSSCCSGTSIKLAISSLPGIITEEYLSEEELQEASAFKPSNFVGVVFKDDMSYQLRFPDSLAMSSIYMESR